MLAELIICTTVHTEFQLIKWYPETPLITVERGIAENISSNESLTLNTLLKIFVHESAREKLEHASCSRAFAEKWLGDRYSNFQDNETVRANSLRDARNFPSFSHFLDNVLSWKKFN